MAFMSLTGKNKVSALIFDHKQMVPQLLKISSQFWFFTTKNHYSPIFHALFHQSYLSNLPDPNDYLLETVSWNCSQNLYFQIDVRLLLVCRFLHHEISTFLPIVYLCLGPKKRKLMRGLREQKMYSLLTCFIRCLIIRTSSL